jgi:hypothetical protein
MTHARLLPEDESSFGQMGPPSTPVPSTWFLTTSTAYSAPELAGLLHPAANHEVRCVSLRPDPSRSSVHGPTFSHRRYPSKSSPPPIAVPHRCGLLPSCRCHPFASALSRASRCQVAYFIAARPDHSTSRPYSTGGVRCSHRTLPFGAARSFHGLYSLRGSRPSVPSRLIPGRWPEGFAPAVPVARLPRLKPL